MSGDRTIFSISERLSAASLSLARLDQTGSAPVVVDSFCLDDSIDRTPPSIRLITETSTCVPFPGHIARSPLAVQD